MEGSAYITIIINSIMNGHNGHNKKYYFDNNDKPEQWFLDTS